MLTVVYCLLLFVVCCVHDSACFSLLCGLIHIYCGLLFGDVCCPMSFVMCCLLFVVVRYVLSVVACC